QWRYQVMLNVFPMTPQLPVTYFKQIFYRSVLYTYLVNDFVVKEAMQRGIQVIDYASAEYTINEKVHYDAVHPNEEYGIQHTMLAQICRNVTQ
ncbi:MAG: hypothetical protein AAGM67_20765, partial [Bacteroidota bacterium]